MPLPIFQKKENPIKIIAVAAGKGGVGKSTLTAQLGLALKEKGLKIGILDADVYGPSIRKMMPEESLPYQKNGRIIPASSMGIKMVSLAHFRDEKKPANIRAPIANGIMMQFLNEIDWGAIDYLLIDFPPGTGDIPMTLCQKTPLFGALLITTPQEVALLDVKKAMAAFEEMSVPVIGIVENLSCMDSPNGKSYPFGKEGGKKLSLESGYPLLGEIPIDSHVTEAGDLGLSLYRDNFNCPAKAAFNLVANNFLKEIAGFSEGALKSFELIWQEM